MDRGADRFPPCLLAYQKSRRLGQGSQLLFFNGNQGKLPLQILQVRVSDVGTSVHVSELPRFSTLDGHLLADAQVVASLFTSLAATLRVPVINCRSTASSLQQLRPWPFWPTWGTGLCQGTVQAHHIIRPRGRMMYAQATRRSLRSTQDRLDRIFQQLDSCCALRLNKSREFTFPPNLEQGL